MTVRLLLADDHQSFVDAVRFFIGASDPAIEVVGAVTDASVALDVFEQTRPEIVLLDLHFPDDEGIKVLRQLREVDERPRVVILSSSSEPSDVRGALLAGASGYLTKDASGESLLAGLHGVAAGLVVLSARAREALRIRPEVIEIPLSAHDLSLLGKVGKGATDEEIAAELSMSRAALQRDLQACIRKLGARNRVHAAVLAAQSGWI